jgi:hypothetical protein
MKSEFCVLQIKNHGVGYDVNYPPALTCPSDSSGSAGSGQVFIALVAGGALLVPQRAGGATLVPGRAHGAVLSPKVAAGVRMAGRCAGGAKLVPTSADASGGIGAVEIVDPGAGYIDGDAVAVSGGGYAFLAQFTVKDGVVSGVSTSYFGRGYTVSPSGMGPVDPRVRMLYPGSANEQDGTVTLVRIARPGTGYSAGSLALSCWGGATVCSGTGFAASFSVGSRGEIESVTVLSHGAGYDWQRPPTVVSPSGGFGAVLVAEVAGGAVILPRQRQISHNLLVGGGRMVSLSGAGFGLVSVSPTMRISASACEMTVWVADSAVAALSGPGAIGTRRASLTAGISSASRSALVSFDRVVVRAPIRVNSATTGSVSVTMVGSGFVIRELSQALRTAGTAAMASNWMSDTAALARCARASAISTARISLTVGNMAGTSTAAMTFDTASPVAAAAGGNGARSGSWSLTLTGSRFAGAGTSIIVRMMGTASEATVWRSDTSLTARTAATSGSTLVAAVTGGIQVGSRTAAGTYDDAVVAGGVRAAAGAGALGLNAPSTGTTTLIVTGAGVGRVDSTVRATLGRTSGETTLWTSDTTVVCQAAGGRAGGTQPVMVSVAVAGIGTATAAVSYGDVWLSSLRPANAPVAGWRQAAGSAVPVIQLLGAGAGAAGPSPTARIGGTAIVATEWVSDSATLCRPSFGIGRSVRTSVSMMPGRGSGSTTSASSFDGPRVSTAKSAPNGPALGKTSLVLAGAGFGASAISSSVRIGGCDGRAWETGLCGGTASESTIWAADSGITCRPARGLLGGRKVTTTAGVQTSTTTAIFSFNTHAITALVYPNGPPSGRVLMALMGASFGWLDRSGEARVGGSGCDMTGWTSDSALRCLLPSGAGLGLGVVVTLGGAKESLRGAFSYDGAVLAAVATAANAAGAGGTIVSLVGADLIPALSPALRLGGTACQSSTWISSTSASCRAAPGLGGTLPATVTVAKKSRATSAAMSYDRPSLSKSMPANVGVGASMLILGAGLGGGIAASSARMRSGVTAAERTSWVSDSAVVTIPGRTSGGGRTLALRVTSGVRIGSATAAASQDLLRVSVVAFMSNGPALGKAALVVVGGGFGFARFSPAARVGGCDGRTGVCGGTACERTVWYSDSALACRSARGLLGGLPVAATAGVQVGTATGVYSFDTPWGAPRFANGPSSGGSPISLIGANFGWLDRTLRGRVGLSACESTRWVSDSLVVCQLARGGFDIAASGAALTMSGLLATLAGGFSYDLPSVTGIASAAGGGAGNGPSTGGANAVILGSGFAGAYAGPLTGGTALQGRLQSACTQTTWVSDSAVVCQLAAGTVWGPPGFSPDTSVTIAGRTGTASGLFSYDRPQVTRVAAASAPATGGPTASFFGRGFGVADYSPRGYVGDELCRSTVWTSDSTLVCGLPAGYGQALDVYVEIGRGFGTPSTYAGTFSYDDPPVLTSGGVPAADYPFLAVWLRAEALAGTAATGASLTVWPDSATAGSPAGLVGSPALISRAVNDLPALRLNSTMSQAVLLAGPGAPAGGTTLATAVFAEGTVLSTKFTVIMVMRLNRLAGAGDQTLFAASRSAPAVAGEDLFVFKVSPWRVNGGGAGVGYEYAVRTVVDANAVAGSNRRMAADAQFHILALVGTGTAMQVNKDGTAVPLVQTHHLEASEGNPPYVRPIPTGSVDGSLPQLDAVAVGALVGSGGNVTQLLDADIAEVLLYGVALYPYDLDRIGGYLARKYGLPWQSTTAPRLDYVVPSNGPAAGGYLVTVYGDNFGNVSGRMRAAVGGVNSSYADRVVSGCNTYSTSCVVFAVLRVPAGFSGYTTIELVADEVAGRGDEIFYYDPPEVRDVEPTAALAAGGATVTVLGVNFGPAPGATILFAPLSAGTAPAGYAACVATAYTSDTALECRGTPPRRTGSGRLVVAVGTERSGAVAGVTDFAFSGVPAYYECMIGVPTCRDCCLSTCQLSAVRSGTATGRTPAVCARTCTDYCGSSLRRAGPPQQLRVGPDPPSSSTVPLRWTAPLDAGGSAVVRYEVSYLTDAGPVLGVSTLNATTRYVLRGLSAGMEVWDITVRAVTAFGQGAPSAAVVARTSAASPPGPPSSLRAVADVECGVARLCWSRPEDDGGSVVTGYALQYVIGAAFSGADVPLEVLAVGADQLCAELQLAQGVTTVSQITVSASNAVGQGLPTAPTLTAAVRACHPPAILTTLADATTLAGEATAPQAFEIDGGGEEDRPDAVVGLGGGVRDSRREVPAARAAAINVRARSSNEAVVQTAGVFVGGIGTRRFVVVTPAPDATPGSTVITLSLEPASFGNEAGAVGLKTAVGASFRVTVLAAWHDLWPTAGPASGGVWVTVAGGGFEVGATDYVCAFSPALAAVDAAASTSANNPRLESRPAAGEGPGAGADAGAALASAVVVSPGRLVCELPGWDRPAGEAAFYLARNGCVFSLDPLHACCLLVRVV